MATITIDGKQVEAEAGQMLIEAADAAGISIPRFCYHKKLSVAANCRMCLVDVEKAPKALPACATPISDGMVIKTQSEKARQAQKSVMEFLLINHPLDCPICDQGGECELQDLAMAYGQDVSRFTEGKRAVEDKNLGPFIATEMTRCIHCTRCVRFGEEISGQRELGATGRGEHTCIGTFLEQNVTSNISGNVIDLCPVGALTAKPSRFSARPWELVQRRSVASHDSHGSNINIHTRRNRIIRTAPCENEQVNEVWLSDRDRFSYEAYHHPDRLLQPRVKKDGQWCDVSWEEALTRVVELSKDILTEYGAKQWGMLVSPNTTVEEGHLLQDIARRFHCHNIDYRMTQQDCQADGQLAIHHTLGCSLEELAQKDCVVVMGSDLMSDLPLLAVRLRRAQRRGQKLILVNVKEFETHIPDVVHVVDADLMKGLAHAMSLSAVTNAEQVALLIGPQVLSHPNLTALYQAAQQAAASKQATLGTITKGANAAGLQLAGCVPFQASCGQTISEAGLTTEGMLADELKLYWLHGLEADDFLDPARAQAAFKQAQGVVSLTAFTSPALEKVADVMLPIALTYENTGSFVNNQGHWQSFEAAAQPPEQAKPAWKIYRVLGNLFGLDGFDLHRRQDVSMPLQKAYEACVPVAADTMKTVTPTTLPSLVWAGDAVEYAADAVCRRAASLQQADSNQHAACLYMHPAMAADSQLTEGMTAMVILKDNPACQLKRLVVLDETVAHGIVWLPLAGQTLGAPFAAVELRPI